MEIRVNKKENVYFALKVLFTGLVLFVLKNMLAFMLAGDATGETSVTIVTLTYVTLIGAFFWFQKVFLVGYLKGNGIEITQTQFPEIYQCYLEEEAI